MRGDSAKTGCARRAAGALYGGRSAAAGRLSGVLFPFRRKVRPGGRARFFVEFITGILLFYKKPAKADILPTG